MEILLVLLAVALLFTLAQIFGFWKSIGEIKQENKGPISNLPERNYLQRISGH